LPDCVLIGFRYILSNSIGTVKDNRYINAHFENFTVSMFTHLPYFGLILFAYLLGSIPFGVVLTRLFTSHDLREKGSGNIGATNVRRVAGAGLGLLTLLGDVLKGAIPVYLAAVAADHGGLRGDILGGAVAVAAFSGHLFPLFLKFKNGGKGVATAAGCFMVLSPSAFIAVLLVFLLVAVLTNYVSAGSIAAAAALPVSIFIFTRSWTMTGFAAVIGGMIVLRHMDNINRLLSGTEPAAWKKRK
jgi:glycerol-3-phosphate acyltransferase PlsY